MVLRLPTLCAALGVSLAMGASAQAGPERPSTPLQFGKVYQENKGAVLRVRTRAEGDWATGVVVGAAGEVLFSAPRGPGPIIEGLSADGAHLQGQLLGYDRALGLAVARFPDLERRVLPLNFAEASALRPDRWVVTIRFNAKGTLEPFAGVVSTGPKGAAPAQVMVPGQPGSPILSQEGTLLGVALDRGERQTRVLPLEAFVPFLKAVVLGTAR